MKKPCRWGHADGEIIEYGMTDCVKRCSRCGHTYMMLGSTPSIEQIFAAMMLVGMVIGTILGIISVITGWEPSWL